MTKIGPNALGVTNNHWRMRCGGDGYVYLEGGFDGVTWVEYLRWKPEPGHAIQWELEGPLYPKEPTPPV